MKKFIALLLTGSMLLSMGIYGSAEAKETSETEEIVITFPTFWCGENVGGVYFVPAVERFNEKYAGKYRVEIEEVIEVSYTDKISQMAQAGTLPVLIPTPGKDWIETVMIPNELYYPMNDFLDEHPEIKDLCLDSSLEYCTQENGDIVSVPNIALSSIGLFYNSALYSPEGYVRDMTVDEFADSLGDNKLAFETTEDAWTTMLFLSALIANEEGGTELLMAHETEPLLDFNQPAIINAVTKLKEIWDKYAAGNSMGAGYAEAANGFMSGQSAVIFNGTWMNSEFKEETGADKWSNGFNGADIRADYYPGNIALSTATSAYGRYTVTSNGTEEELECALAFLEFVYSPEEVEQFSLIEGCQIPNLEKSDEYVAQLEEDVLAKDQSLLVTSDTKVVPYFLLVCVPSLADVYPSYLAQVMNGAITPEQFCEEMTIKSLEAVEN